jgi:UrcA family protein
MTRSSRVPGKAFAPKPLLIAGALCLAALPSIAQTNTEELVVTGHLGTAKTMSYAVTYADLDLQSKAGRSELYRRIRVTSDYLCHKMGEGHSYECSDEANRVGMSNARKAERAAHARGPAWKPGAVWKAPQ